MSARDVQRCRSTSLRVQLHSMGGNYGFDAALDRAIAVNSRAIREALQSIYAADRFARELGN